MSERPNDHLNDQAAEPEWKRKRRIAEIFGDVLPDSTRDDQDPEGAADRGPQDKDAWLRAQVPPHHGKI